MDLYCPKCGEPLDNDELHDQPGKTYRQALHAFQTQGCAALGYTCSEPSTAVDDVFGLTRQDAASALYDLLGDDADGAAAMMQDLGW